MDLQRKIKTKLKTKTKAKPYFNIDNPLECLRHTTRETELSLVYLQIFEKIVTKECKSVNLDGLILPSSDAFRLKEYFKLVQTIQKGDYNNRLAEDSVIKNLNESSTSSLKMLEQFGVGTLVRDPSNTSPPVTHKCIGQEWKIREVAKAARILNKPPLNAEFEDELDMRKTYSLVYEVFRFKSVLNQALEDVEFFGQFPEEEKNAQVIWLFMIELARRRWASREKSKAKLLEELLGGEQSHLVRIEKLVWDQRVHFTAAIARLRIKNKAFSIPDLLPDHLRDDRYNPKNDNCECVTGWVNKFKISNLTDFISNMTSLGYSYSSSRQLCALEYRFDRVCQRFITLRPPARQNPSQAQLFKEGSIVIQEREFCEGASVLCRVLRKSGLRGHVAQTHAHNPRATAYLAAQLSDLAGSPTDSPHLSNMPDLGRLYVFGAGDKLTDFITRLKDLGIEASPAAKVREAALVLVWAEPVFEASADALEGVVAALASPPNSYSSVSDPVDLICSTGGDLEMLEILTESDIGKEGSARIEKILEEQKRTLDFLMTKPQIQLVLYETHSAHNAENEAMVSSAVHDANTNAKFRHLRYGSTANRKLLVSKQPPNTATTTRREGFDSSRQSKTESARTALISGRRPESEPNEDVLDTKSYSSKISVAKSCSDYVQSTVKLSTTESNLLASVIEENTSRPDSAKSKVVKELKLDILKDFDNHEVEDETITVTVPKSDLFEIAALPALGNGLDLNYILDRDGCFLGLIQRQKIVHLNAKFMITVAEKRGLFVQSDASFQLASAKTKNKDLSTRKEKNKRASSIKRSIEINRISAPTHSSKMRALVLSAPTDLVECTGLGLACCCSRHMRQQRAAGLLLAQTCNCDKKHLVPIKKNRISTAPQLLTPRTAVCRQAYPLKVHDVRFAYRRGF